MSPRSGTCITNRRGAAFLARLLAAGGVSLLVTGAVAADAGLSAANRLLFRTPHLEGLQSPAALHYRLQSSGREGGDGSFVDEIVVRVHPNPDGRNWRAEVDYLSGKRQRPIPPVDTATGNPIVKVFLQREVLAMEERTGGNWRYFQKAIKRALAESAEVARARIEFRGQTLQGRRIGIAPFRDDPRRGQMGVYARMRYTIVLSDAIPGGIFAMTATVDRSAGDAAPAFAERLRLQRVERLPESE